MTTATASRGAAGSSGTRRGEANVVRGHGSVGVSGWCGWERGREEGWSEIEDFLEMVDNVGRSSVSIEKGSGAACIEDSSEEKIPMAKGEVTEEGDAFFEAKVDLRDVTVLFEEFGVDADVVDNLELREVELVVAGVDAGAAKDEAGRNIVDGEGVEVEFKSVKGAKKEEWALVDNAEDIEGISDEIGVWFGGGEDNTKHVVCVQGIAKGLDADFLGGDEVHDCSSGV
jgi:hypothetical protein